MVIQGYPRPPGYTSLRREKLLKFIRTESGYLKTYEFSEQPYPQRVRIRMESKDTPSIFLEEW